MVNEMTGVVQKEKKKKPSIKIVEELLTRKVTAASGGTLFKDEIPHYGTYRP